MPFKINASDVSAVIGKNKFKTKEEVFERIAIENGLVDFEITNLPNEVESLLTTEIQEVMDSKTAQETERCMKAYESHATQLIVSDLVRRSQHQTPLFTKPVCTPDIVETTIAKICKDTPPERALEATLQNPGIQKFLKESPEVTTIVQSINTLRGQKLEEQSTDAFQKEANVIVESRNTKCYIYRKNNWIIAGRVDGLTEDAVIETKTRRRFWKSPPEYDIIQLRVYMKLCNRKKGVLNEQFPDQTSRSTPIDWDDSAWNAIETQLDQAMDEFEKLYC